MKSWGRITCHAHLRRRDERSSRSTSPVLVSRRSQPVAQGRPRRPQSAHPVDRSSQPVDVSAVGHPGHHPGEVAAQPDRVAVDRCRVPFAADRGRAEHVRPPRLARHRSRCGRAVDIGTGCGRSGGVVGAPALPEPPTAAGVATSPRSTADSGVASGMGTSSSAGIHRFDLVVVDSVILIDQIDYPRGEDAMRSCGGRRPSRGPTNPRPIRQEADAGAAR